MFYIYAHCYEKGSKSGQPFYIGMGNRDRTLGKGGNDRTRNSDWHKTVAKYGFKTVVLAKTDDKSEAELLEMTLIMADFSNLVNRRFGSMPSLELLEKMKDTHPFKGKKRPEHSKKMSGAGNGRYLGSYLTPFGIFDSPHTASKATGIPATTIWRRCKILTSPKYDEWSFLPKEKR